MARWSLHGARIVTRGYRAPPSAVRRQRCSRTGLRDGSVLRSLRAATKAGRVCDDDNENKGAQPECRVASGQVARCCHREHESEKNENVRGAEIHFGRELALPARQVNNKVMLVSGPIVPESAWDLWLDRTITDPAAVADLLKPAPDEFLIAVPVSPRVNNPRSNDPECVTPTGPVIR